MPKLQGVNINPFKGLLDNNKKNPHSRVLRTSWFTKMADTFKVFFGNTNPLTAIKNSSIGIIKAYVGDNPAAAFSPQGAMAGVNRLQAYQKRLKDFYKASNIKMGLLDFPFLPVSYIMMIGGGIIFFCSFIALLIPTLIGGLLISLVSSENIAAQILGGFFGAIFLAPLVTIIAALMIVNSLISLTLSLIKAAASAAMTLIAMPIVSIVQSFAYIKSHELFTAFKTLQIKTVNSDTAGPSKSSMDTILSVLNREDYRCYIANENATALMIYKESGEITKFDGTEEEKVLEFSIAAKELKNNRAAFSALCKLNLLRVQNNPDFTKWCRNNELEVPSESLRTPLLD